MEVEILGLIILYDWFSILQISPREMLLPNFLPQKFPAIIVSNNLKMSVFAFQAAHMMSHDAQSLILMLDQFVLLHGS